MFWRLNSRQSISFNGKIITFQHTSTDRHHLRIYLNTDQFQKFDHVCQLLKHATTQIHLLIDRNIWLESDRCAVAIVIRDRAHRFFKFHRKTWDFYIKEIHRRIYHTIKNGRRTSHCQRRLHNGKRFRFRSAVASLQSKRDKVLSRPSSYVKMDTGEQEDCTDISQQKTSNFREGITGASEKDVGNHNGETSSCHGQSCDEYNSSLSQYDDSDIQISC